MQIERLVLKNNIGIWDGLGLKEIEVNFPKESKANAVTLIIGKNGSGKSVLLSNMTPYWETHDDRTDYVIPEESQAYKEVVIRDKDDIYIIEHHYKDGKIKSFFNKNSKELNENGGVRTFKTLVEEHLGLTADFFKVGKIGSNVSNFIDLNSSDRKRFISKFVPDIEPYQIINKQSSEKLREDKRVISFLSDELKKLSSQEEIDETITRLTNTRDIWVSTNNNLASALIISNKEKEKLNNELLESGFDSKLLTKSEDLQEAIENETATLNSFYENHPKLLEIEDLTSKIQDTTEKLIVNESDYKHSEESLVLKKNEVLVLTKELDSKNIDFLTINKNLDGLDTLETNLIDYKEKLAKLIEFQSNLGNRFEKFNTFSSNDIGSVRALHETVQERTKNLISTVTEAALEKFEELLSTSDPEQAINLSIQKVRTALEKLERELHLKRISVNTIHENLKNSDVLKLRPTACKIDACGFIRNALRAKQNETLIPALDETIANLDKDKISLTQQLEEAINYSTIYKGLNEITRYIKRNLILSKFPLFECTSIKVLYSKVRDLSISNKIFEVNKDLDNYVYANENIKILEEKVTSLTEKLALLKDSNKYKESIEKDISTIETKLATLTTEVEELVTTTNGLKIKIARNKAAITLLNNFKSSNEIITNLREVKKEVDIIIGKSKSALIQIKGLDENIKESNLEKVEAEKALLEINEGLDKARLDRNRFTEYLEQLAKIEASYDKLTLIKKVTDVTKGIPVKLIDKYLNTITDSANELLDIAYKGNFNLGFEIDDKDLTIPVFKSNGSKTPDIAAVSQGQKAMTKTTLSFAIFKEIFRNFNILTLDEIDAELDAANRRAFLDILNQQIKLLNLEQVFVISHNQEFFSQQGINLILLPEHNAPIDQDDFMVGKTIVADFS